MFGRTRSRRRRSRERAHVDAVLRDAQAAAETARAAFRSDNGASRKASTDEAIVDAIQAAILGSIAPSVGGRPPHSSHSRTRRGGGAVFLVGLAVGIGVAAWARRDSGPDASSGEGRAHGGLPSVRATKTAINTTLDRADDAIRRAVDVTAGAMGSAVEAVAEAASPAAEKVSGQLKVARHRATSEMIRALDDIEDVWGDDDDTQPVPVASKPAARKPVARKTAAPKVTRPKAGLL